MRLLNLALAILLLPGLLAAQNLDSVLKPKLEGKIIELRWPQPGRQLKFTKSGTPAESPKHGLRSVDAYLLVKKIEVHGSELRIEGARQAVVWDVAQRRAEYSDYNFPATVSIELPNGEATTEAQFAPAFYKVFFSGTEMTKRSCSPEESQFFSEVASNVSVQRTRKDDIRFGLSWADPNPVLCFPDGDRAREVGKTMQPPKAIKTPDPTYSEAARRNRVMGASVFMVIVDEYGVLQDAIMVRSLEPSLNYNSLEALREWRFDPCHLDGKPVACAINVVINYRLR